MHSVRAIWRHALNNLANQRQGRTTTLQEETGGIDLSCVVDPFRSEQVFRNILENALAACNDPAEIKVTCSGAELEGQPALSIAVRDNGPGLNPEQRRRIFEPFFTTKTKGTGLGMAIAQRIVKHLVGRLLLVRVKVLERRLGCCCREGIHEPSLTHRRGRR